jgi:hypothetical protein
MQPLLRDADELVTAKLDPEHIGAADYVQRSRVLFLERECRGYPTQ